MFGDMTIRYNLCNLLPFFLLWASGINWWALVVLALVSHNLRFNEPSLELTQENCEPCVTVPGDPSDHLVGTYK